MNYVLDAHTHTLVSGHAYSTIREMATAGKKHGLELLCITEHAPKLPGAPHEYYFQNLKVLRRDAYEIPLLFGSEVNLIDAAGHVDMDDELLSHMDVVIASIHPPCVPPMSKEERTASLLRLMENPHIHIIGHPDDGRLEVDYTELARVAHDTNTLIEVNNSSLLPTSFRMNAMENYKTLLRACERYGTYVVLNSDAHVDLDVGRHDMSSALLESISFPEELVVNRSVSLFKSFLT